MVEPVTVGAAGRGWEWGHAAEHGESGPGSHPVRVAAGGDQELAGDAWTGTIEVQQGRIDRLDQWLGELVEVVEFGDELLVTFASSAKADASHSYRCRPR